MSMYHERMCVCMCTCTAPATCMPSESEAYSWQWETETASMTNSPSTKHTRCDITSPRLRLTRSYDAAASGDARLQLRLIVVPKLGQWGHVGFSRQESGFQSPLEPLSRNSPSSWVVLFGFLLWIRCFIFVCYYACPTTGVRSAGFLVLHVRDHGPSKRSLLSKHVKHPILDVYQASESGDFPACMEEVRWKPKSLSENAS